MHASSIFLLALSTLSSALPTTTPSKRAATCASTSPQQFTIAGFTTFTPADGNPVPASVTFTFGDLTTSIVTRCTGTGPHTPGVFIPCANPAASFTFDGQTLTLQESYTSCSSNATVVTTGSLHPSTYCYPSEPPIPNGYGTQCQTPSVSLTGGFSS